MNVPFLFAQQTGAPAGPSGGIGMSGFLFQIFAIIAIFYFVLIRPQQRERKRQEESLLALKKGDEVVTSGGIVADVLHIQMQPAAENKEQGPTMTDRITVRSSDSKLVVERGRIARVIPKGT